LSEYLELNPIKHGESADLHEVRNSDGRILIKKQLVNDADDDQRKRFLNEIAVIKKVESSFIIPIIESDIIGERPFYIMPRADMTLRKYSRTTFGYSELGIMDQIIQGIKVIHQNKILHLDLNPDNILVFLNGREKPDVRIADFGLSLHIDELKNIKKMNKDWHGTLGYIPYRDLKSINDADYSSDIFNLGRVLYRILTGQQYNRTSAFLDESGFFGVVIMRTVFETDEDRFYHNIDEFIKDYEQAKNEQSPSIKHQF
jgi:eukaryotic-like serine/threonine-protein kinase